MSDPTVAARTPSTSRPRSVLLVDDQPSFRAAVRTLLEAEPAYNVVGEAIDGDQAVELALALHADLVLMDVRLPGTSGVEATRRILARDPLMTVVLVSTVRREDLPPDLLDCGAIGFLQKEELDPPALHRLISGSNPHP